MKSEINAVRKLILQASPSISEAIKWNAPSFKTSDFFATFHLRSRDSVKVVLHMGAKAKATAKSGVDIRDPKGLLKWLGRDRAIVEFGDKKDVAAKKSAFTALIVEWIQHVMSDTAPSKTRRRAAPSLSREDRSDLRAAIAAKKRAEVKGEAPIPWSKARKKLVSR